MSNARVLRRGAVWYLVFAVITAVAGRGLIEFNAEAYYYSDPQDFDQNWQVVRGNAAGVYTSGMSYGQLLAFVLGALLANATVPRTMPVRYALAVLGACGLAAVNFAASFAAAGHRVEQMLVENSHVTNSGVVFDSNLSEPHSPVGAPLPRLR